MTTSTPLAARRSVSRSAISHSTSSSRPPKISRRTPNLVPRPTPATSDLRARRHASEREPLLLQLPRRVLHHVHRLLLPHPADEIFYPFFQHDARRKAETGTNARDVGVAVTDVPLAKLVQDLRGGAVAELLADQADQLQDAEWPS